MHPALALASFKRSLLTWDCLSRIRPFVTPKAHFPEKVGFVFFDAHLPYFTDHFLTNPAK
jgi:hypothetical protein